MFEQKSKNIEHPSIVNSYEVTFLEKKFFFCFTKMRIVERGSLFSMFALSHFFSVCVFSAYFWSLRQNSGMRVHSHWLE